MKSRTVRITNTTLQSLKAGDKAWFVRDEIQRGFQIKISPSGQKIYQVEARLGGTGRVKKFKIGNVGDIELAEARKKAYQALKKIRDGIDPLLEKRAQTHEGSTLDTVIGQYLKTRRLKQGTIEGYTYLKNRRFSKWLDKRVKDITKHEIRDWYLAGRGETPTQTEQAFKLLNAVMNYSRALEIITDNPCDLVTAARERYQIRRKTSHLEINNDLPRFLTAFVKYKYLRDSEKVARDIMVLILTTGLRKDEARTITWDNVDMKHRIFTIRDTKNHRDHVVPMTPLTYSMFKYRRENSLNSDYVFRVKSETKTPYMLNFQKTLNNICELAEVPRVTPHDLRRTFATVLNSLAIGYADLKFLMNHMDRDVTTGIYIQPDIEVLRGHLFDVVNFYDLKIPVYQQGQGISQYTRGTMRMRFYGEGDMSPIILDDPTEEAPDWIAHNEWMIWEE